MSGFFLRVALFSVQLGQTNAACCFLLIIGDASFRMFGVYLAPSLLVIFRGRGRSRLEVGLGAGSLSLVKLMLFVVCSMLANYRVDIWILLADDSAKAVC